MKNLLSFAAFVLFSFSVPAQKISGLYSGTLYNDSTRMVQQYELALSEYRGKVTGYSYVTYVVNDTFYYGIRKIIAHRENDNLIVEDDKMLMNNFPESPAKRVRRITTIPLNGQDSLVNLNGRWTTNKTREYYAVPGAITASRNPDSSHSPLIAHLKELRLIDQQGQVRNDQATAQTQTHAKNVAAVAAPPKPIPYEQRKVQLMQTVTIQSDSLLLSFYDNGVVDGDSISVYLNGINILSHNRLTAVAMKKVISTKGLGSELTLLVVADNLGTIPPNTGLVVIHDGDKVYQVNFAADLQTNASIVFKKEK